MNPLWWYGIGYVVGVFVTAFISGILGRRLSDEDVAWTVMFWPFALVIASIDRVYKLGRRIGG